MDAESVNTPWAHRNCQGHLNLVNAIKPEKTANLRHQNQSVLLGLILDIPLDASLDYEGQRR